MVQALSVLAIVLIVSLASGIYAFIGSLSDRKKIRRDINRAREARKLLIIASIAATGTFFSLCLLGLSLIPNVEYQSPKNYIINDLNSLAASAYQYRNRSISEGGGGGTYLGYQIPKTFTDFPGYHPHTPGEFSYRIIALYGDSISFEGQCQGKQSGAVRVKIDSAD